MRLQVRVVPEELKARVSPRTVDASVSVPVSYKDEVQTKEFYAYVTLSGNISPGDTVDLPARVFIPDEYRAVARVESVEPPTLKVTVPKPR